jgi:D-glycero-beta-D-manno-heptose-7-phosphate kinase
MNEIINKERLEEILNNFSSIKPVFVLGDIGLDKYTEGEVKRISPEAPVPVLEVTKEWYKLGLASNVADNLNSLGIKTTICGFIGNDKNAGIFETLLEENNIKTWGIIRDSNRTTTYKERVITPQQQICRIDYETNQSITDEMQDKVLYRLQELAENHNSIILEDYGKGFFSHTFLQNIIKFFKEKNKFIACDPSRFTKALSYKGIDLLKPNRDEAIILADGLGCEYTNIDDIAKFLFEKLELKQIVITLGKDGILLMDNDKYTKPVKFPTISKEIFDVSGAGDTVISSLVGALESGADLYEACWLANCAAGVVVGKRGTAKTSIEEISYFYSKLNKQLHQN